jgi:hypothetical protein
MTRAPTRLLWNLIYFIALLLSPHSARAADAALALIPDDGDCGDTLSAYFQNSQSNFRTLFLRNSLNLAPPANFARQLVVMYPELKWLTMKVHISPEDAKALPHPEAFSPQLFQAFHPEVERTLTSLVVLQQILKGDYDGLTKGQVIMKDGQAIPSPVKLKAASFDFARQLFFRILSNGKEGPLPEGPKAIESVDLDRLDALITYMAIHDLGKSKRFEDVATKVSGKATVDHDRVLLYGLSAEPMLSTSFERLPAPLRKLLSEGISADFNIAQFAQGENVPASLNELKKLSREAFDFFFAHLFLDVAGSTGVKNPHGSNVMIEPVFNGYRTGYEFLPMLFDGMQPNDLYKFFLQTRAGSLALPFSGLNHDYAIARAALMARAGNPNAAQNVKKAFESLPRKAMENLVEEMAESGNGILTAILPYYSPALIDSLRITMKKAAAFKASDKARHPVFENTHPVIRVLLSEEDFEKLPSDVKMARLKEFEGGHNGEGIFLANESVLLPQLKALMLSELGGDEITPEAADSFALKRAFELLNESYVQARSLIKEKRGNGVFTSNMNKLAAAARSGLVFDSFAVQTLGPKVEEGANVEMYLKIAAPEVKL